MYTLNATFDAQVDQEEVLAKVLEVLPTGTKGTLEREAVIVSVPDLNDSHVGTTIRAKIGTDHEFAGAIEQMFTGEDGGLLLIVDSKPRSLNHWEVVQITPPLTVGEHTADDEPEEEEADEFNLSPDDYNHAVELAVQAEAGLSDYLLPIGWLSRAAVETLAERVLTAEEFTLIALSVRQHLTPLLETVLDGVVLQHLAALNTYEERTNND